jgi:hypothetical protein
VLDLWRRATTPTSRAAPTRPPAPASACWPPSRRRGARSRAAGWRDLPPGGVADLLGARRDARWDSPPPPNCCSATPRPRWAAPRLSACGCGTTARAAGLRLARPEGFTPDMGAELIAHLARVIERVAGRWPVL